MRGLFNRIVFGEIYRNMEFLPLQRQNVDKLQLDVSEIDVPRQLSREAKILVFDDIIVKKQLDLFGLSRSDFVRIKEADPNWSQNYVLTEQQYDDLKKFAMKLLKKLFRWNQKICYKEWSWYALNNTLSIKYEKNEK